MKSGSSNVLSADLAGIRSPNGFKKPRFGPLATTSPSSARLFIQSRKGNSANFACTAFSEVPFVLWEPTGWGSGIVLTCYAARAVKATT